MQHDFALLFYIGCGVTYSCGDTEHDIEDLKLFKKKEFAYSLRHPVVHTDDTDVCPRVSISESTSEIYGLVDGPFPISLAEGLLNEELEFSDFVRKVIQTLLTTLDGQVYFPTNFTFCHNETGELLKECLETFKKVYGIHPFITVSDACGSNRALFSKWMFHHFCYSHIAKNARNSFAISQKKIPIRHRAEKINNTTNFYELRIAESEVNMVKLHFTKNPTTQITRKIVVNDHPLYFAWIIMNVIPNSSLSFFRNSNNDKQQTKFPYFWMI